MGSLCTRTRRGCRRPPAALKAICYSPRRASQCRKHLHFSQEKGQREERREEWGQWATSVRRMPVTCFTYVCFVRTKNKTSSRQNKNCLSTTITTSRKRRKGAWKGGRERESSRLRLASLWVSASVSANVLLSKPVQQWRQCHKLSRAFGANSDLATRSGRPRSVG